MKPIKSLFVIVLCTIAFGCSTLTPAQRAEVKAKHQQAVVQANAASDAKLLAAAKHPALHPLTNSPTINKAHVVLASIAGICFVAGLGLIAAAVFASMPQLFRIGAVCFIAAAVTTAISVFLNTIIVVTGVVLVVAAVAFAAYAIYKHKTNIGDLISAVEADVASVAGRATVDASALMKDAKSAVVDVAASAIPKK
jgi:hypothetical protein